MKSHSKDNSIARTDSLSVIPDHLPELLLPVGNMEMCYAAIHNGADAIYVGMPGYNARGRSKDHEIDELKEMIETCHLYGVKVNLAFNIVIFEDEFNDVIETILKVLPLKPDALIIQDIGLARLVKKMAPKQVIHASTQMTVTNHDAIHFLSQLDFKRFVLGRENSLDEIGIIAKETDKELEVFVHGALCVAYSGQCFTSESLGGRSANRGQCAQSCRLSYDLIVDGKKQQLVDRDYLVSPKDLCGIAEIPSLLSKGVKSFKVEGRLKGPEYVAAAGRVYKPILENKRTDLHAGKRLLSSTYSRGFFSGWLHGVNHQELVEGTYNEHRGLEIGKVRELQKKSLTILVHPGDEIKKGDGLLFHFLKNQKRQELGGRVYGAKKIVRGDLTLYEVEFSSDFKFTPDLKDARVFKTNDPELDRELTQNLTDKNAKKRIPISAKIVVQDLMPLEVSFFDGNNLVCYKTESPLSFSEKTFSCFDENFKVYKEELKALSATAFYLTDENIEIQNLTSKPFWIHQKEIKNLRRQLSDELTRVRAHKTIDGFDVSFNEETPIVAKNFLQETTYLTANKSEKVLLNVLLREKSQVEDLVSFTKDNGLNPLDLNFVILDFEYGQDYSHCLSILKEAGFKTCVATTRILKPKEYHHLKVLNRLNPDAILVRNLGAYHFLKETLQFRGKLFGDFSLNITNHMTADFLFNAGFDSLTLSYDLTAQRITDLLKTIDSSKTEVTLHQYMPSFHMEHCVFAAFLSKGSSYRDCGKPCEEHRVELVDQFGHHHHIRADQECRNTMFNATSQSAATYLSTWKDQGLGIVRFEAMYEKGDELYKKVAGLISLVKGEKSPDELISELNLIEKYGLGAGVLSKNKEYKDRKK